MIFNIFFQQMKLQCPFLSTPEENYTLEIFLFFWFFLTFGSSITVIEWMFLLQLLTFGIVAYLLYYVIHKDSESNSLSESLEEVKEMIKTPQPSPKEEVSTEFSDLVNRNNAT